MIVYYHNYYRNHTIAHLNYMKLVCGMVSLQTLYLGSK